jgi:hypothetical protein
MTSRAVFRQSPGRRGVDLYAGGTLRICVVDRTGKIEREGMGASDPEVIAAFVRLCAPLVARVQNGCNIKLAVYRAQ